MPIDTIEKIKSRLQAVFTPTELSITDESHFHAGHAGAQSGKGHYALVIRAEIFAGKPPINRHKMIYQALEELMDSDIHALSIKAGK